jgi:hypothetical protein
VFVIGYVWGVFECETTKKEKKNNAKNEENMASKEIRHDIKK